MTSDNAFDATFFSLDMTHVPFKFPIFIQVTFVDIYFFFFRNRGWSGGSVVRRHSDWGDSRNNGKSNRFSDTDSSSDQYTRYVLIYAFMIFYTKLEAIASRHSLTNHFFSMNL